jgi:hypothetical protein
MEVLAVPAAFVIALTVAVVVTLVLSYVDRDEPPGPSREERAVSSEEIDEALTRLSDRYRRETPPPPPLPK